MTMLPSLMFGHMIFAESLAAILTLLVLWRYTSTFVTFFQIKSTSNGDNTDDNRGSLSLSLDGAYFLVAIPLQDQLPQKFRAIVGEVQLENSHASVVSFLHYSRL